MRVLAACEVKAVVGAESAGNCLNRIGFVVDLGSCYSFDSTMKTV